MSSYTYLFDLAVILLFTKLLGVITKKIALPQVVGALMAGLLLGPACLNILHETAFMDQVSEIGVIVLMFTAGLETDIKELKRSGKAAVVIALFGVLVPLIGGTALAYMFNVGMENMMQNVFVGVVLTATSVSITVEALKEMGKLSTRSGNAILGAALVDDILGIIVLTVITGASDPNVKISTVLLKIVGFFVLSVVAGLVFHKVFQDWMARYNRDKRRFAIAAFAFCLLLSFAAEEIFGVADITGAFIAGLIISNTTRVTYLASRFETLSFMLLSPVFFANIGLKVDLPGITPKMLLFTVLLTVFAVISKVVACDVGARMCKYDKKDSFRIGVGMVARGEVALIVASKGMAAGLMNDDFFAAILIMVVATAVITPILLKFAYRDKEEDYSDIQYSPLADQYEEIKNLDLAAQALVDINDKARQNDPQRDPERKGSN